MEPHTGIPVPQPEAVASAQKLYTQLQTKAPDLVDKFETKYSSSMDLCTWLKEKSPNSAAHTVGPDFDALVDLDQLLAVDLCMYVYPIQ